MKFNYLKSILFTVFFSTNIFSMRNVVDESDHAVKVLDLFSSRFYYSLSVILRDDVKLSAAKSNVLDFFYEESCPDASTFEQIITSNSNDLFIDFLLKFLKREGFKFTKDDVIYILGKNLKEIDDHSGEKACCSMF